MFNSLHGSHVTCHVSHVTRPVSHVACHMYFFFIKWWEQVGERCVINVGLLPYTSQFLRYCIVVAIFSTSTNTEAQYSLGLYIVVYSATVGKLKTAIYSTVMCAKSHKLSKLRTTIPILADPGEARGCSTNTSVIQSIMVCENIFTAPPRPGG